MQVLNNRYVVQKQLGRGAYGVIYCCYDKQTKRTVAVKKIAIEKNKQADMNEINLLKELHHPNIVQYYDSFQTDQHLFIVMEYCEGGSLQQLLAQFGSFSEQLISNITYQILQALIYLHSHGILHRDLKCANILCDKQMHIKLTDFGISEKITQAESNVQQIVGSPFWIAREVLLQESVSEKSDIWSLGATLYELISGKPPYSNLEPCNAMYRIMTDNEIPNIPTKFPDATEMIRKCFIFDVKARPTAKDLLKEKFIVKWNRGEQNTNASKIYVSLLSNFSLSEDSESDSVWSDDSDEQSQSAACRRKSRQVIQNQQEIQYALQEQIKEFIDNSFQQNVDVSNLQALNFINLEEITDQSKQLSVFIYDTIQRKLAIKALISKILQPGLIIEYKQTIFMLFSFLFMNLQQQKQEELYEQILMSKFLETMPILNEYIQNDVKNMLRVATIFIQKVNQFVDLLPVFVSLGGIQYVFSQSMLYNKNKEIAAQTVNCIHTIIYQQDWNNYYACFISNDKIYNLLLDTLKNFSLYSIQHDDVWIQTNKNFQQTDSDYDHRQLKEHCYEHFSSKAQKIYNQNCEAITNILKTCQTCVEQQILSTNNVLKKEHLEFLYQLTEFFTQCYKTRHETSVSQQCEVCRDMQNQLQKYLSILLTILSRIHQYVFKSNYQLQDVQQIVYQNLDKIMDLDHTNQELNTRLVLIIFELFTIDDKYEFIRKDNQTFLQLLLNQKGETQYGVIKHMVNMPLDLYNQGFLQRLLDYNIANQLVTYLKKEKGTIQLYAKMLKQLKTFRDQKRSLSEKYRYKIEYEQLVNKVIQNFESQKLIANICTFCFDDKNQHEKDKYQDLIALMNITNECSKYILSQNDIISIIFKSFNNQEENQYFYVVMARIIYNQADNVKVLFQDMQLKLRLQCLAFNKQTNDKINIIAKKWYDEIQTCQYLL